MNEVVFLFSVKNKQSFRINFKYPLTYPGPPYPLVVHQIFSLNFFVSLEIFDYPPLQFTFEESIEKERKIHIFNIMLFGFYKSSEANLQYQRSIWVNDGRFILEHYNHGLVYRK